MLNHDEWTEALASRFFRPDFARKHVMFFVDRATLADICGESEDEAASQFIAALLPEFAVRNQWQLFNPIYKRTAAWKAHGSAGSPPCLPTLALAVLAASEMRRTASTASHNYYTRLIELLSLTGADIGEKEVIGSYGDSMPGLWGWLKWWLDERHRGARGFSTITEDEHWTKIGFADSQTIFASSDHEKLGQFFAWMNLAPKERVEEAELLEYFRAWSSGREDVNVGARTMLDDENEHPAQLADILQRSAAGWEGSARTQDGRREAPMRLLLVRFPRSRLSLVAACPPGFPDSIALSHGGRELSLDVDAERASPDEMLWYDGLEIDLDDSILRNGLRLLADDLAFRLPGRVMHVLHMDGDLGGYASFNHITPATNAWILIRSDWSRRLRELLRTQAAEPGELVSDATVAPAGWDLIRDVVVDRIEGDLPAELSPLAPRVGNRLTLTGGLPLERGRSLYLTDGEPAVTLPDLLRNDDRFKLDGDPLWMPPDVSAMRLEGRGLGPGEHTVQLGALRRTFTTLRSTGVTSPRPKLPIGHAFEPKGDGFVAQTPDAAIVESGQAPIVIEGAAIRDPHGRLPQPSFPVILPRAAKERILLGAQPGDLEIVDVPDLPPWMQAVDLKCQRFEHHPPFPVAFAVLRGPGDRKTSAVRVSGEVGSPSPFTEAGEWAHTILLLAEEVARVDDPSAWGALVATAREVLSE